MSRMEIINLSIAALALAGSSLALYYEFLYEQTEIFVDFDRYTCVSSIQDFDKGALKYPVTFVNSGTTDILVSDLTVRASDNSEIDGSENFERVVEPFTLEAGKLAQKSVNHPYSSMRDETGASYYALSIEFIDSHAREYSALIPVAKCDLSDFPVVGGCALAATGMNLVTEPSSYESLTIGFASLPICNVRLQRAE